MNETSVKLCKKKENAHTFILINNFLFPQKVVRILLKTSVVIANIKVYYHDKTMSLISFKLQFMKVLVVVYRRMHLKDSQNQSKV